MHRWKFGTYMIGLCLVAGCSVGGGPAGGGTAAGGAQTGAAVSPASAGIPSAAPTGGPITPDSSAVIMSLRPAGPNVPADMPPGEVRVTLPLYPGASATDAPFDRPFEMIPASPYLKVARTRFRVPAAPAVAEAWYRQQMPVTGYQESGSGTSTSQGAVVATGIEFESQQDSQLHVILSFQDDPGAGTRLQYLVTDIATPNRPAQSQLPTDVLQIDVTYRPDQPEPPTLHRTITDQNMIAPLVAAINGLGRDTRGVHGCLADFGQGAELTFVTASGAHRQVVLHPACSTVTVDGTVLVDGAAQVWNEIKTIMSAN